MTIFWLKLFIWPVPVAFDSGCVEGLIFLGGVGAVKVARAIEFLEAEAQGKRGHNSKFTYGWRMAG